MTTAAKAKEFTSASLKSALQKHFGFDKFKGDQEKIIKSILSGKDTFVIMPTGGGKSLCYQLPALCSDGVTLIISPLIALMKNQVDLIRGYSADDNIAHFLNSSLNKTQQKKVKSDLKEGKTKLLYVAPETLTKQENIDFFQGIEIAFVAVDEAHCISEWGHDFRPEYRKLKDILKEINSDIPIIALTATATPKVQDDIIKNLDLKEPNIFISSFNRANLYYEIIPKTTKSKVLKHMVRYIQSQGKKSGIIYTLNRKSTEELAQTLCANGINSVAYHAGLDATTRAQRQDMFLKDDVQVIVATIAFGMGIDKPDVRFVMHYNIPKSLENYYQETGRAGRDGLESRCILYYSYKDVQKLEHLLRDKPLSEREMGAQLITETVAYVESGTCRRRQLLYYFGEFSGQENCDKCDNCCNPKEKLDVKDSVIIVLNTIKSLDERFGIDYVVDVILGKKNPQIHTFKHNTLPCYGSGQIMEMDDTFWHSLIRQMMLENFIRKDIEEYGLLKINEDGDRFLKAPHAIKVALRNEYREMDHGDEDDEPINPTGGGAVDETLLEILKDLRKKVAKEKNLPPYVVFQETSLEDMTLNYPTSMQELEKIQGVSKGKAMKFGKKFIELISQYVSENDIEKPDDFIMKSAASKSGLKVFIIQNIDKKVPLENIASSKDLSIDELLENMEAIVAGGTKLNIGYCLEDELDEDDQGDIYDFFRSAPADDLDAVYEEFKDYDISMEHLKLMRMKFISEFGN